MLTLILLLTFCNINPGFRIQTVKAYTPTTISNPSIINESENVSLTTSFLTVTINQLSNNTFNWTIQTSPNIGNSFGNNETNGTKSCSISGLSHLTNYTWYVNATDGDSWVRKWYTFTTRDIYNPSSPVSFSANENGRFQIDLSWTKANNATHTYIEYNTTETWQLGEATEIYNNTGESFSHIGLNPNTTYYYQAWSFNIDDNAWSDNYISKHATTGINILPTLSSPNPINGSTNQYLAFTWSISISDPDGDDFNWDIECSNGQSNSANSAVNGTKQLSISGLSCNTNYSVWVNVTDGYDWGKAWFTFTTGSINLPPIADAGGPYEDYINEPITVSGSGSSDPDGTIVSYRWDWGINKGYTSWSSSSTASHTYTTAGDYTIILEVKDNLGETDIDITTITINPEEETEEELTDTQINQKPVADAGGPYYEMMETSVQFDGSDSYDLDGTTLYYKWEFGDGKTSTSKMPTHTYSKDGNYTVKLTVTDEDDETDTDTTFAIITKKPNNPPEKPIIKANTTGFVNISINFSANSTDPDADQIQYIFNWSNGANNTISPFLNSSQIYNTSHSFSTGGIYTVTVYTLDENNASSETESLKIMISTQKVSSLGYLIDKDGDGVYDVFYCETTGKETKTEKNKDEYTISINDDNKTDYIYNLKTDSLTKYSDSSLDSGNGFKLENKWILLIGIICIIALFICLIIFLRKTKKSKKPKKRKKKPYKYKKKKTKKVKHVEINLEEANDEKVKNIEEEIDKLLKNKK